MNDPTITQCIVVADDESGTRSFLGKLLRSRGYEVLEACDGEEALALVLSRPVDLVLLDLQMPRMRGESAGRWIDQLEPPVPVILMTAFPNYESALDAVRCHAADYLEKPFRSLDVVVQAVEKALRRRDRAARRPPPGPAADAGRRLATAIAEDVRRPLQEVRGLAGRLLREVHGPLTTEQREILEHLDREAETGEVEASKAEFLARLEEPEFIPTLQAVPASELVHAAARTLGTVARAAGIDLRLEVPDAGVGALADAGELPRALRAIGENALRFSPEGGQVSIRAVPEADGVRFEVEDHGIGIDPADHARIFEPFVRLESPVTRQRLGCGLGLAFAARIVRSHGAEIAVRSALGEGACFSFVLPYAALLSTQSISMEISLGGGGAPTEPL